MTEIHLFEPTGYAGIFQHACQLAEALSAHAELRVLLHTASQHEAINAEHFEICKCSWWPRSSRGGWIRTRFKQAGIAAGLVAATLPHLLRSTSQGSILHVQGPCASGALNYLFMRAARLRGCRVVYSPHDTFSRRGWLDDKLLQMAYKPAHSIIVYSNADQERLRERANPVLVSPLIQSVPQPSNDQILSWRRDWDASEPGQVAILCAGHIRPDKRLDLLIESARHWPKGVRLAVVGEDRGAWAGCVRLAEKYKIKIASRIDFVPLEDFSAAIAAADMVVVPSERASQSGVLMLARQLGTPTIAADVGGLRELASRTFASTSAISLTAAVEAELENPSAVAPLSENEIAVDVHLRAYGLL